MSEKTSWWRSWEITIDSNWITTGLMAVLLVVCVLLLAQEIHRVALGHFFGPVRPRISFWSIWNKVFQVIAAIYFFLFAFKFPKKSVRIASVLMGTDLAVHALLSFVSLSLTVGQIVAVSGSFVRQIALIIYCVAIAQWFKSVVSRSSPSESWGNET
ncbi:MAG TPA: hypothetical protein VLT90_06220 [Terriglobales bacterium]|nr:hypothetical protein [Terriglobales bacterium]